jgi:lipopolysaccharide biosynthesis protein
MTKATSDRQPAGDAVLSEQRHLAFYLPQFHPIPENDAWWGPGFTEWTNVAQARPRFRGHYQPHVPADLGFYDLRLAETRRAQADLARAHGIDGFVYYHYWFDGRQVLQRPFDEVLTSGDPDFPFALCWANENWTRAWDGEDREVLLAQSYAGNERAHAEWLVRAFRDERYIRVDGKPLFLVYRASQLPDPLATTRVWRDVAREAGIGELFLCRVEGYPDERTDPRELGFDAGVEFAPDWMRLRSLRERVRYAAARRLLPGRSARATQVLSYDALVRRMQAKPDPGYLRFPCVTPGWDNTPRRREGGLALHGNTPEQYAAWVASASASAPPSPGGESLVFVNAWNEWAEGAHLEPCRRWGHAFLEAHRSARSPAPQGTAGP